MADGARTAGARIVAALLRGPGFAADIEERSGCDRDTVYRWLSSLESEGVAVRRGAARVNRQTWATVWAINTPQR